MGSSFLLIFHQSVSLFDQNVDMSLRLCHVFKYDLPFVFHGKVLHRTLSLLHHNLKTENYATVISSILDE